MEEIVLKKINKKDTVISFDFRVSAGLSDYFSGKPFVIEYPEPVESVPDAVAAVPFVCNVLPIVWLTDSVLRVKELDKAFYDCIPNVRHGYEMMFPESAFAGTIAVDALVPCDRPAAGGSAAFFSGGLDAMQTLVSHLEEKPALLSVWGSDIHFDNTEGWQRVHRGIQESAQKFGLPDVVIRSSFREFDREGNLERRFSRQLQDGWWHGVKHGIGLLGHAAPYAYLHGLSTVYIASSNCPADGPVRCASDPRTDNHVRFACARVVHDGFEFSRQDKVRNVVAFVQKTGNPVSLHVCWESQSGGNCCHCEKCYRTIAGLLAEGADPAAFGFENAMQTLPDMQRYIVGQCSHLRVIKVCWPAIHDRICENSQQLQTKPYWKQIQWIASADFSHPEALEMPFPCRVKNTFLLLSQKLHTWCHEKKRKLTLWKSIAFPLGKKVYLLGTPLHTNIGDSAIVLAEKQFLCHAGIPERRIIELTASQLWQDRDFYARHIGRRALLCWHGGGNMGNQWMEEEALRREVLPHFPANPTILFPQTIYYTPDDAGRLEQERSVPTYNGRANLTLVAREQTSYEIMGQLYPDTSLILTPDIVLSATMETFGVHPGVRDGVLLCMRGDAERSMTDRNRNAVESLLHSHGLRWRITDMYCEAEVTKEARSDRVREKMEEFTRAALVITDRLHGMVFAAITGTPCIVFSNYNHKVRGTYAWIKYLPYIRYAETAADVERVLPELLSMEGCRYDNAPLMPYFEKLAQAVRDSTGN